MRLLSLLLVLTLTFSAAGRAADPLPNIVLIFTDDQGYGDAACFGSTTLKTPNLDRLAAEGRRFTNFHVSSPVCSASRAALLTGCLHPRVGIHGALGPKSETALHPDEMTIAELLKQKGYATAAFGKWHLGRPAEFLPPAQGFDEYFGVPYSTDMWPKHPENPEAWPPLPLIDGTDVVEILEDLTNLMERLTDRAVKFVARHRDRPFFLYFASPLPHVPLFARRELQGASGAGAYGDAIAEIDRCTGDILAALEAAGVAQNTLVIFTSDNGPWLSYGDHSGSSGPFREGKGTSWEGGIRVPCIMRWPGRIPAGSECTEPLMTIDILPTLAAITGAPPPPRPIDGRSILPLLTGEPGATCPHPFYPIYFPDNRLQAILSGEWKLILPHTYRTMDGQAPGAGGIPGRYRYVEVAEPELYNLRIDPGERENVARRNPEILAKLLAFADTARASLGDRGAPGPDCRAPGRVTTR